ncbi:hypothetical protein CHU92_03060 [Flavobacterium cyanobacteriorum]|uniref:DUF5683 domain-containing protein n=2 Tax=Flavobacterium cyanobacteriorum TaxID=2022802 RepID=A0A255ZQB4_9FLAO|nr:hypothetical protein CHU92_03060 [Flavobacterium cyanobacteriorum]
MRKCFFILLSLFLISSVASAQNENDIIMEQDSTAAKAPSYKIDPLAPSKAAFYSAIVPGLGQVYNKKYWKVPIVYGGLGLSLYYYSWNNTEYHRYRDAYKDRLAGRQVSGELANLDNDRLLRGQRFHQRNRDLSMLITIGIYILNIVDANVDAHLMQFNVNENLSLRPQLQQNQIDYKHNMGLTLSYQF